MAAAKKEEKKAIKAIYLETFNVNAFSLPYNILLLL